jgi:hypothetical protein
MDSFEMMELKRLLGSLSKAVLDNSIEEVKRAIGSCLAARHKYVIGGEQGACRVCGQFRATSVHY